MEVEDRLLWDGPHAGADEGSTLRRKQQQKQHDELNITPIPCSLALQGRRNYTIWNEV